MAVAIQPSRRRDTERRAVGHMEGNRRGQIVRSIVQSEAVAIAQTAVELRTCCEVFPAEAAGIRTCRQRQWPAHRDGIPEFPGIARDVLLGNHILGQVPPFKVAAQDQLQLHFPFFLATIASTQEVAHTVMPHHFQQSFVRAVNVLKLCVEHGIDPVLLQERTKTVLKAEAGKQAALIGGGLRIKIKFRCPPCLYAVLQFYGISQESVAGAGKSSGGLGGELQIARLLHVVRVGNKVISLRERMAWKYHDWRNHDCRKAEQQSSRSGISAEQKDFS